MVDIDREVQDLMLMARNWKRGYETWIDDEGGNEYVFEEFEEEIHKHMLPYINRLYQTEHISAIEANELFIYCTLQVEELRKYAREREAKNKSRNIGEVFRNSRLYGWLSNARKPK